MEIDLLSPTAMADHTVVTCALLHSDRVVFYEKFSPPFYVVSRYADIEEVLRKPDVFISGRGQGPNFIDAAGVVSDAPDHTFFRKLVQESFQPAAIARLEPRLGEIADEALASVATERQWDLHDTLAFPLPIRIICEVLGIPTDEIWQFKMWSDASVAALASNLPETFADEREAMTEYLVSLLEQKRQTPDGSLIARIANAERDGQAITNEEALALIMQIFVAGNETTTSLITNFVWRLGQLNLWAEFVRGDLDLDQAINESLRFDPPLLGLFRTTSMDTTLAGTNLPAGSKVMTYYAAANRDPEAFPDPDTFLPDRKGKRVMSFGVGIHFCLGSELARLEARIALDTLRRWYPNLEVINDGVRIPPFLFWGRCKLPVRHRKE